jgi:hypothetical protein
LRQFPLIHFPRFQAGFPAFRARKQGIFLPDFEPAGPVSGGVCVFDLFLQIGLVLLHSPYEPKN